MALDTDLSLSPYFDDFSDNANQYAVLYRPGVPVQAREMNQVQSILQDQINKFGRSIYKEGSVIEGCAFSFDDKYSYVKIKDTYSNGSAFTISDFVGRVVSNANGLKGLIVDAQTGFESQAPDLNTLYVKYLNSGTYSNGSGQQAFSNNDNLVIATSANVAVGNVTVATIANSSGYGYAMTVTDGVIFKKGYFIRVPSQTAIVTKYSNQPNNVSVGFGVIEDIETPASNTQLYDNAQGAPNYGAPGAHRLKLTPNLITRATSDTSNTAAFFSICDYQNGQPVTIKTNPQYSALGTELAQRTYETNGDFVVNPFLLSVNAKDPTVNAVAANSYHNLISGPGIGYVKGYRVDFLNNVSVDLRKGNDYESLDNQSISMNFGYYVNVAEFVGDFNVQNLAQVEIHSVAKKAITNQTLLTTSYSSSTKIGTAYIRGIEYSTGTPGDDAQYSMYLFNVQMNAGFNFNQAASIIYYSGSLKAVADVVLSYDYTSNTNIALIEEIPNISMIYPLNQRAVKQDSFTNTSYVYRNRSNASFTSVGSANATLALALPAAAPTGTETFLYTGTLSSVEASTFDVIPTVNGYSTNSTGTVSVSNVTTNVTGSSTTFTTSYSAGDFIYVAGDLRRVVSVTNNTLLAVNSAFSAVGAGLNHQEAFPAGLPIPFVNRSRRSVSIASNTTTFNLGSVVNASFSTSVCYDLNRQGSSLSPIPKAVKKSTLVRINVSNNAGGTSGPWCLGIPDVLKINKVWLSTNGSYSNTATDVTTRFSLDSGQRDTHYDLAYLKSNVALPSNALLLVSVDNFTSTVGTGVSFFTANSYPVDDVNTSNTQAISTTQIPQFTSPSTGAVFDLRDSIDFRPMSSNTASVATNYDATPGSTTAGYATENPATTLTFLIYNSGGRTASYLPSANKNFNTDLAHYLPRRDRVAIDTNGKLYIKEGMSEFQPLAPVEDPNTMTLGILDVPPYPTLTPYLAKLYGRYDYSVSISLTQTKRYTMGDIGVLDNRISKVEYYTSLNALEQSTTNLQVRSDITGQNRFKNGIMVEPFRGHDIGNTLDPQYRIAVDTNANQARPFFEQVNRLMRVDTTRSAGLKRRGDVIAIDHTEALFQQQPYASKYHNCIEGNVYEWKGNIVLNPPGDTQPSTYESPDVVNNLDLASNWVNLQAQEAWGTTWSNWVTTSSSTNVVPGAQPVADQYITSSGGWGSPKTTWYTSQLPAVTTSSQVQTGTTLGVATSNTQLNLGTYVTDISISPYVRQKLVLFKATGLKPNTRVYAYFNDIPVSDYCAQITPYTGTVTTVSGIYVDNNNAPLVVNTVYDNNGTATNEYYQYTSPLALPFSCAPTLGAAMTTSSNGSISGVFQIPSSTFRTGDLVFKLLDISDLTQGESAISTQATATYVGSGLSVSYGRSILNTRQAQLVQTEVTQTRTIQTSGYVPGPNIAIVTPSVPPHWFSDSRLKRNIVYLNTLNGIKLYKFQYLWSSVEYVGVMAQEIMEVVPEAVRLNENGYYTVNYGMLGIKMMTYDEYLSINKFSLYEQMVA